ncbi:SIMPL domain-containing protein [Vibrio navarrensis]|nr:SIMPL domain-containing protein [Vibrio navarrensis]
MKELNSRAALILGISLMLGLGLLGYFLQQTAIQFKAYERVVTVKGLSEREYPADTVIWPIQFTVADNDVQKLFTRVESQTAIIETFLKEAGIDENVTLAAPAVIDKKAQQYGGEAEPQYRYLATQTITVFSTQVDVVRQAISQIGRLGKQGIVFNQDPYYNSVVYSFTKLNDVKPDMIEEATKNAREVAEKFAKDSHSTLGKIRNASQGQFTIYERDSNTPHIKIVRVVSTVQYYLSD